MEKINELPNPADFMKLGENAFIKNVHQKLREKLSPTEKQMWVNGYLLALTQQERSYSEEEVIQLLIKFNQEIQEVEDVREWLTQFKNK